MKFSSLISSYFVVYFLRGFLTTLSLSSAWSWAMAYSSSSGLMTLDMGSDVMYISWGSSSLGFFLSDSTSLFDLLDDPADCSVLLSLNFDLWLFWVLVTLPLELIDGSGILIFLLLFAEFNVDLYDFWELSCCLSFDSDDCFYRTGKESRFYSSLGLDFRIKVSSLGLGGGLGTVLRGCSKTTLGLLSSYYPVIANPFLPKDGFLLRTLELGLGRLPYLASCYLGKLLFSFLIPVLDVLFYCITFGSWIGGLCLGFCCIRISSGFSSIERVFSLVMLLRIFTSEISLLTAIPVDALVFSGEATILELILFRTLPLKILLTSFERFKADLWS